MNTESKTKTPSQILRVVEQKPQEDQAGRGWRLSAPEHHKCLDVEFKLVRDGRKQRSS